MKFGVFIYGFLVHQSTIELPASSGLTTGRELKPHSAAHQDRLPNGVELIMP